MSRQNNKKADRKVESNDHSLEIPDGGEGWIGGGEVGGGAKIPGHTSGHNEKRINR